MLLKWEHTVKLEDTELAIITEPELTIDLIHFLSIITHGPLPLRLFFHLLSRYNHFLILAHLAIIFG